MGEIAVHPFRDGDVQKREFIRELAEQAGFVSIGVELPAADELRLPSKASKRVTAPEWRH